MTLLPADPARRNAVLAVVLALSSIYFVRTYVYSPTVATADAARLRLSELRNWNQRAAQEVRDGSGLGRRLAAYQSHAASLERLIAAEDELGGLLEAVSQAARTAGAELASVRPGAPEAGRFFELRSYDVQVAGSYHAIGRLATAVASLDRIVVPRVVAVVPADGSSGTEALGTGDPRTLAAVVLRVPVVPAGMEADADADDADDPAETSAP